MAWIPPKTNWSVEDVPGLGDFERIEGNIAALESGEAMPKGVLLRAVPSDEVILEANTQRDAHITEGTKLVKEFVLKYPGIYRFKCEVRQSISPGEPTAGSVTVSVSGGSGGKIDISSFNWQPKNLEIITGLYGSVVRVSIRADNIYYVHIRNARICGTLTMAEPEYAVLRD